MNTAKSISGFGADHELRLSRHAATLLAGKQELPRAGYEILLINDGSTVIRKTLALQNICDTFVLVSCTHERSQWPEAFGVDQDTGFPLRSKMQAEGEPKVRQLRM